ncbi:glycosyltransferase [Fulvivirga sp. M361]|uniref:glycosyltransferase n=1 Tax=Fulvivirga sp. M361 TaxID=2594266 RepID=UPI001629EBFB|nr:glycosyltransferase [Fulvivirga sp. M361]
MQEIHPIVVSVVIPAYNAQHYLKECIDSVRKQTIGPVEIIVVDDGSSDGTKAIVDTYDDDRLRYFYQKNSGVAAARNLGANKAQGSYLAFLDADDMLMPSCLQERLNKLSSGGFGLVHNTMQMIDGSSGTLVGLMQGKEGHLLDDLLLWEGCCIPTPSSIMVTKTVFESVGGFNIELSNNADQEFFFRVANKCIIGKIDKPLAYYRLHPNNMHKNIRLLEKDSLKAYSLASENHLFKSGKFENKCYSNMYMILAANFLGSQKLTDWLRGIKYIVLSLYRYPANIKKIVNKVLR